MAEVNVLFFKLCALLLGTDLFPPDQPSLFQKINSDAALKEFKSSLHRMKSLQCASQIKPPVLIVNMPSQMSKAISFLQPTVP